jgi:hypothetical protein
MKLITLLALATASFATPLFPDFTNDGVSIQGSPAIGRSIDAPGRYLFALEDLRLPFSDYDYNDLYGEVTVFDNSFSFYSINVQGGLGSYFNAGTVGFAGARFVNDVFTLVFNTPTGEMYSGTSQVLLYKLTDIPTTHAPEPSTYAIVAVGLLALGLAKTRKKLLFKDDYSRGPM